MTQSPLSRLARDTRGVSFNIGYTISIGITAVLLIGVIASVGGVMQNQQDKAVHHQVDVIGDQVASSVMATDRLGSVGSGTNATIVKELPSDVVGTPYSVRLVDRPTRDVLVVEALHGDYEEAVPINIDSTIQESVVAGGSTIEIVHQVDRDTGARTIRLQPQGEPPAGVSSPDSYFAVSINSITPSPAGEGDAVTVTAEITNTGSGSGSQNVVLQLTGVGEVDAESVSLNAGESETVTFEWGSAVRTGSYESAVVETRDAMAYQSFVVENTNPDSPGLTIHDFSVSDKSDSDAFDLDLTVEEFNDVEAANVDVTVTVDSPSGTTVYEETIHVGALEGETTTVTFGSDDGTSSIGPFTGESGRYTIAATADASNASNTTETDTFTVRRPANFDVTVLNSPPTITPDDDYVVDVEVENTGEVVGSQTIDLTIDGVGTVDQAPVDALAGGESQTVTLTWPSDEHSPGEYAGTVTSADDIESHSVAVEENDLPVTFDSITVTDRSTVTGPRWQHESRYTVEYTVDDPDNEFSHVEFEIENQDLNWDHREYNSREQSDTLTHSQYNGPLDDYNIVVQLYSESGEVVEERVVIANDRADGMGPNR